MKKMFWKNGIGFCVAALFFSQGVLGEETEASKPKVKEMSVATAGNTYSYTSDDVHQYDLDINYRDHRRDFSFPYENEWDNSTDFGANAHFLYGTTPDVDYYAMRFYGLFAKKFSRRHMLEIHLGAHFLEEKSGSSNDLFLIGSARYDFRPFETVAAHVAYIRDLAVLSLMLPRGATDLMLYNQLSTRATWYVVPRLRITGRYDFTHYSDNNFKNEEDLSAMFGLFITEPWIWIGAGVNQLNFDRTVTGYWSPSGYFGASARLDSSIPIHDRLSFYASGNIGPQYDFDSEMWAWGYYLSTGLIIGNRNETNVKIGYVGIYTSSDQNYWLMHQGVVEVNYMF